MEDTDRARSSVESAKGMVEDLRWIGIDWDEGPAEGADDLYAPEGQKGDHGPYFQSQRLDLYRPYVDRVCSFGARTPEDRLSFQR